MLLSYALLTALQAGPAQEMVRLDLPEEVELKVFVDYVAAALDMNVLYDNTAQLNKRIAFRVSEPIPKDSLLGLLHSVLQSRGLALVEASQPGWRRIVAAERLQSGVGPLRQDVPDSIGEAEVVTVLMSVRFAELERVKAAITPSLSKPGGSVQLLPESRVLLISDYAGNVRRIREIAKLVDVEGSTTTIEVIPVRHQDPVELATLVRRLVSERTQTGTAARKPPGLTLQPDPISGGLIAIGYAESIGRARKLVERFDVPIERRTELYRPRFIAASRLRTLVEQLVGATGLKLVADDASNTLIVTARPEAHTAIDELLTRFDSAPDVTATPMRFYKLLNRRADDVFATLGALLGGTPSNDTTAESSAAPGSQGGAADRTAAQSGSLPLTPRPSEESQSDSRRERGGGATAIRGENFSLSLDEHINSIIAVAPPELHRQIETLVQRLDVRRPQVLVEVTLVSISVDDSLNLGVELEGLELGEPHGHLLFTSFGLSAIDPTTGARSLTATTGGTGVLLAPDEVPIILQALQTRGNTRVYSAPRILVDDNASGRIESVAESPFTSVNAGDTVATTSFAGFAKAGTQLTVEPHIAEGDHLEINYQLTVSSFTGSGTGTTPPPRTSDTISSTIRVPDGHTVVVGGLLSETLGESASQVPLIGDVPLIGWLFGSRTRSTSKVRLYAFIRPTILRDDGFADLKYMSRAAIEEAGIHDGSPPNRLQYMP